MDVYQLFSNRDSVRPPPIKAAAVTVASTPPLTIVPTLLPSWLQSSGVLIAVGTVAAGMMVIGHTIYTHRSKPPRAQGNAAPTRVRSPHTIPDVNSTNNQSGDPNNNNSNVVDDDSDTASSESSAAHSPTARRPKYEKLERIGRGAYGVVYKGRHTSTGDLVAIKEMAIEDARELRVEFDLLAGLRHENIIMLLGFEMGTRHARLYLEWAAGGSLARFIKKFPITDENLVRRYVTYILRGLCYLHEHHIIHRDIKPANVLIDHRGVLKLTDFGLSRHLASMKSKTRLAGTPVYMAPECVYGHFGVGSDIWAVGATMSEIITRQTPWSHIDPQYHDNPIALLNFIGNNGLGPGHHPIIPPYISVEARDFMQKCFSRDPRDRGTCAELLQHPWIVHAGANDDVPLPIPNVADGGGGGDSLSGSQASTVATTLVAA